MDRTVEVLSTVSVTFALALALALLVERFLEVLKSFYDWIDSHWDFYHVWTRIAHRTRDGLERRLRLLEYLPPEAAQSVVNRVNDLLLNTQGGYDGNALLLSGDLVRVVGVRLGCKTVGVALGIVLACWLEIDLVTLWPDQSGLTFWAPEPVRRVVSGIVIGLGASPVHKIITTIERRRAAREAGDKP
jgi:hypothetical protein